MDAEEFFRSRLGDVEDATASFEISAGQDSVAAQPDVTYPSLPPWLDRSLRAQATRLGIRVEVIINTAFGMMVAYTSGRQDVVFGTMPYGSVLPLRLSIEKMSAWECVQGVQRELVDLKAFDGSSLEMAQRCSRVHESVPLFNALLSYVRSPADARVDSRESSGPKLPSAEERFPITLLVEDEESRLHLKLETDQRIDAGRVAAYTVTALVSLVNALDRAPHTPVRSLAVLPEDERYQILEEFNATDTPYPQDSTLHRLFERQVMLAPTAVAVIDAEETLTYAELNSRANQLANYLRLQGVRLEEHLPVVMTRSSQLLIAQLAILKVGGVYVPLDPALPLPRLLFTVQDCAAQRVLGSGPDPGLPRSIDWIDCIASAARIAMLPTVDSSTVESNATLPAYVMYTSGSTGIPKGVLVPHRGIVRLVINNEYLQIHASDRIAHGSNPAFDAATFEIWGALLNGATLVILPQRTLLDPRSLAGALHRHLVNILFLTTALFNQHASFEAGMFCGLRCLLFGGEAADAHMVRRVLESGFKGQLLNIYGPTETTAFATWYSVKSLDPGAATVPIGGPISNTRVYILDASLRPVPLGVTGEIYIGGPGVACGYLNRPALTAERFIDDPFRGEPGARLYRTGDLGRWLQNGLIEYLGRNDQQIKIRGFRVELAEIEARLAECERVKEAVVLAREDVPGEKRLVAYVVYRDAPLPVEGLRSHLRAVLPEHMVPAAFVVLDHYPLTPNGKLDRRALPAPDVQAYCNRPYEFPQGEAEEALAMIWQDVLHVERVGRHDNFFELGGHSLLGPRLESAVEKRFGVQVSTLTVFQAPSIREMALSISDKRAHQEISRPTFPTPRLPSDRIPLSYAQRWLWQTARLDELPSGLFVYCALRLRGPVHYELLQKSIGALVERHQALSTRIYGAAGVPEQCIGQSDEYDLAFFDLSRLAIEDREAEARRLTEQLVLAPYAVLGAPLFGAQLLRIGPLDHRLILAADHLIADGLSVGIIARDVCTLYTELVSGRPSSLPPVPCQFADYVVWQEKSSGAWTADHGAFWAEHLSAAGRLLLLVDEVSAEPPYGSGYAVHRFGFGAALSARAKRFSRQQRTTNALTFLSAFVMALAGWSECDDVVVAFSTLGRLHPELDDVIGCFSVPLFLRIPISEGATLLDLSARVHEEYGLAYGHHDCGRVAAQVPEPQFARNPFFNWIPRETHRDWRLDPSRGTGTGDLEIEQYNLVVPRRADLAWSPEILLALFEGSDEVSGEIHYRRDCRSASFVEHFADSLRELIEKIVSAPLTRVTDACSAACRRRRP